MKKFRHMDAKTLSEVISLQVEYGEKAQLLAGGTDLLGLLKTGATPNYPDLLINIKTVPGLDRITLDGSGLKIGALARLSSVIDAPEVQKEYPMLAQAALSVAMPQIRYMGTLGGNLAQETRCWYYRYPHQIGGRIMCQRKGKGPCLAVKGDNRYHALFGGKKCFAVCPSDTAVALATLDARIEITGPGGKRFLDVTDFYHALGNALAGGEMITEVRIPRPSPKTRQIFVKHRVRESIDFAIVSVGLAVTLEDGVCSAARIVLGAVAPGPYRAQKAEEILVGSKPRPEIIENAATAALSKAVPLSRNAFKVEIAKTLIRRGLESLSQPFGRI